MHPQRSHPPSPRQGSFPVLRAIVGIESCALVAAIILGIITGTRWWDALRPQALGLWGIPCGLASAGLSIHAVLWMRRQGRPHTARYIDRYLLPAVLTLTVGEIVLTAILSGMAEEILFRGVMQQWLGLWLTCAIFGVLHTGTRELLGMGVWSAVMSLVLGGQFILSGTLWCPILAHGVHNFATMLYLRGPYLTRPERQVALQSDGARLQ